MEKRKDLEEDMGERGFRLTAPQPIQSHLGKSIEPSPTSRKFEYGFSRSSSAPPIEKISSALPADLERELGLLDDDLLHSTARGGGDEEYEEEEEYEELKRDPSYANYFHWHSRLDPRLPAPEYRPGQSSMFTMRRKLIDMIQEDFPRTPSPVYISGMSSAAVALEEMSLNGNGKKWNVGAAPYVPPSSYAAPALFAAATSESADSDDRLPLVLEDLRLGKTPRYSLAEMLAMMSEVSCDQHGSRYIQQRLEMNDLYESDIIFEGIRSTALQLMTDVFGNYVIQKMFEHGSERHRVELARAMQGAVVSLSLQMYGCRVIQKALENLKGYLGEQALIVEELRGHVLSCVKDQNGNHVIQKCIETVPLSISGFILEAFRGQVYDLATHPYGCRVIQRILENSPYASPDDRATMVLLEELAANTQTLVLDQYGNYVVQHILEKGSAEDRQAIINAVLTNLLDYSKHKFASNVVERCICYGTVAQRQDIVSYVVGGSGEPPLYAMIRDQYGNYVVQKMMEVLEPHLKEQLLVRLRPHYSAMRKYTYGKHILSKLEKLGEVTGLLASEACTTTGGTSANGGMVPVILDEEFPPLSAPMSAVPSSPLKKRPPTSPKRKP